MRKALAAAVLIAVLSAPAHAAEETVTLQDVGRAVHLLIDLYQHTKAEVDQLKRENAELKKKLSDLESKFVILKMKQNLLEAELKQKEKKTKQRKEMASAVVVVPPDRPVKTSLPWITFKRSDAVCVLPERKRDGYLYYNVLVTRSREKAVNLARNVARTGLCAVVRRVYPRGKGELYRVVVIPNGPDTARVLKELGLDYYPYVRRWDFTKSSGGEL